VWPHCGVRAGVDGDLETWMPLVVDVLWIQCGGSGLKGVCKAGRNKLVMCGLIAVEGLARTVVWENWSRWPSGGRVDALRRKRLGRGFGKLSATSCGCVNHCVEVALEHSYL
jgi:hypothetical protein